MVLSGDLCRHLLRRLKGGHVGQKIPALSREGHLHPGNVTHSSMQVHCSREWISIDTVAEFWHILMVMVAASSQSAF
jgi:hypothetical protein